MDIVCISNRSFFPFPFVLFCLSFFFLLKFLLCFWALKCKNLWAGKKKNEINLLTIVIGYEHWMYVINFVRGRNTNLVVLSTSLLWENVTYFHSLVVWHIIFILILIGDIVKYLFQQYGKGRSPSMGLLER